MKHACFAMLALFFLARSLHGESAYLDEVDEVTNERTISLVLASSDEEVVLIFTDVPSLSLYGRKVLSLTLKKKKKNGLGIFTPNLNGPESITVRGDKMSEPTTVKSGWITYKGDYYQMAEEYPPVRSWLAGNSLHLRAAGNGTWTFNLLDDENVKKFNDAAIVPYFAKEAAKMNKPLDNSPVSQGQRAARRWNYSGNAKPTTRTVSARARAESRKAGMEGEDARAFVEAFTAEWEKLQQ